MSNTSHENFSRNRGWKQKNIFGSCIHTWFTIAAFASAVPYWSGLNKLMRYKPLFPLSKLAELVDSQPGYLCLLFSSQLPHYNGQTALWPYFNSTSSLRMVTNPLLEKSLPNKCLGCEQLMQSKKIKINYSEEVHLH